MVKIEIWTHAAGSRIFSFSGIYIYLSQNLNVLHHWKPCWI